MRLKVGDVYLPPGASPRKRWPPTLKVAQQFTNDGFDAKAVALYKQITEDRSEADRRLRSPGRSLPADSDWPPTRSAALQSAADSYHRAKATSAPPSTCCARRPTLDPTNTTSRLKVAEMLHPGGHGQTRPSLEYEEAGAEELERQGEVEGRGLGARASIVLEVAPDRRRSTLAGASAARTCSVSSKCHRRRDRLRSARWRARPTQAPRWKAARSWPTPTAGCAATTCLARRLPAAWPRALPPHEATTTQARADPAALRARRASFSLENDSDPGDPGDLGGGDERPPGSGLRRRARGGRRAKSFPWTSRPIRMRRRRTRRSFDSAVRTAPQPAPPAPAPEACRQSPSDPEQLLDLRHSALPPLQEARAGSPSASRRILMPRNPEDHGLLVRIAEYVRRPAAIAPLAVGRARTRGARCAQRRPGTTPLSLRSTRGYVRCGIRDAAAEFAPATWRRSGCPRARNTARPGEKRVGGSGRRVAESVEFGFRAWCEHWLRAETAASPPRPRPRRPWTRTPRRTSRRSIVEVAATLDASRSRARAGTPSREPEVERRAAPPRSPRPGARPRAGRPGWTSRQPSVLPARCPSTSRRPREFYAGRSWRSTLEPHPGARDA